MQILVASLLFEGNHSTLLWILNLKEGIDGSGLMVAYSVQPPGKGTADMPDK